MLGEILVSSPHKEATKLIEEYRKELNINVSIHEISFHDAVNLFKDIILKDPHRTRVIVSGGATLKLIRQELDSVPVTCIDPTEYDLVLAFDKARMLGNKIGLLRAETHKLDAVEKLGAVLGIPIKIYEYDDWQECCLQIKKACQDGIEVMVGVGERIGAFVQENGLKFVPALAGRRAVRLALEWAKEILEAQLRDKVNVEKVKTIAAYSEDGIIAVNEENIISVFNQVASKLFGLNEKEVIGRSLQDLSHCRCLVEIFEGPEKRLGFPYRAINGTVLVNKIPIVDRERIKGILVTLKEITKIQEENETRRELLSKGLVAKYCFDDFFLVSSTMNAVIDKAKKFANTDCTVLIRGESGTGKELLAQSLHNGHSLRSRRPFVAVNCASLDHNLLRSELFGYADGAFTGANKGGKAGLFEIANGGTLFLDEVGKMELELQANLLRVLQEKEVRPIGSDRVIPVDVRVIAASNEDLKYLVSRGAFREDLFYRLDVLRLTIPPLRERKEDIPGLLDLLLKKISGKYGKSIYRFSPFIVKKLSNMDWPGNIRQLEHFLERCVILADNDTDAPGLVMELLEEEFASTVSVESTGRLSEDQINVPIGTLAEMNAEIVRRLSSKDKISNSELALRLGISRPTLIKMLNYK